MKLSRIAAFSSSLLLGAVLALTGAGQASGPDTAPPLDYVALGDSYSSGLGAGSYDSASGDCKRSTGLSQASGRPRIHPRRSRSPLARALVRVMSWPVSSAPSTPPPTSSRITIGGNDAGFADVMTTCVLQSESSLRQPDQPGQELRRLDPARQARLGLLGDQSKAPAAQVVVLGYPRFYKLGGSCIAGLSENERPRSTAAADYLNAAIAKRAADHGYDFADVAPAFTGHEICSGSPGCTASTGSTSASPTTPPPPDSPAATCPSSPPTPDRHPASARPCRSLRCSACRSPVRRGLLLTGDREVDPVGAHLDRTPDLHPDLVVVRPVRLCTSARYG